MPHATRAHRTAPLLFSLQEKLCHFWFNTFFLVDPALRTILSDSHDKQLESNLGLLKSCLIPNYGHTHLYTMIKKDIDGLHKDKLHRLAPPSFSVGAPVRAGRVLGADVV